MAGYLRNRYPNKSLITSIDFIASPVTFLFLLGEKL
jgi:hypothetical protein